MEKLAVIFRTDAHNNVYKHGFAWIKKESEAHTAVLKNIEHGEVVSGIWIIDWRDKNAKYKMISGASKEDASGPRIDVAADMRRKFLRSPKQRKVVELRPHKQEPKAPAIPAEKLWHPIVPVEAK